MIMACTAKICELNNGMINVTIEGVVRLKSLLSYVAKGKYLFFYLFDEDNNAVRIVAFNGGAVKWFDKIDDKKWYRIGKASVVDNVYNNVKELQIVLGSDVTVEELESKVSLEFRFTALCALKHQQKVSVVDVIGRIVCFTDSERILKTGEVKNVVILTLMDSQVNINPTFWEHVNVIRGDSV